MTETNKSSGQFDQDESSEISSGEVPSEEQTSSKNQSASELSEEEKLKQANLLLDEIETLKASEDTDENYQEFLQLVIQLRELYGIVSFELRMEALAERLRLRD